MTYGDSGAGETVEAVNMVGESDFGYDEVKKGLWYDIARVVSMIMHPLAIPFYMTTVMLCGGTLMSFITLRTKLFFMAVVLLNTMIVPALFIGLLKSTGFMSDFSLNEHRGKVMPLFVAAICFAFCAYMVPGTLAVFLIRKFLIAGVVCILAALAVTWFWKVSLHMMAAGGALAMLIIFNISWQGMGVMFVPVVVFTILCGLLGSARLYLGAHTPAQVGVGFVMGFVIVSFIVLLG